MWTSLKSEHNKIVVFERKILRRIFGPRRDEGTIENPTKKKKNDELNRCMYTCRYQVHWGKLEKDVFNRPVMHGEKKE